MIENNLNFGGFIAFAILGVLVFVLEKKYLYLPIILTALYVTNGQKVVLGGFNFFSIRIILLLCWVRIILRREYELPVMNNIDKFFIFWAISSIITNMILWQDFISFKQKFGFFYDTMLLYGLYRISIRNFSDIESILKSLIIIIIPVAILMLYESRTGHNVFSYFGGVSAMSEIREGRVRAAGPFRHSILSGTFGATTLPLFVALYASQLTNRSISIIGIISCLIIIVTSASSGPLMAFIMSLIAFSLWFLRDRMKEIRWGILLTLISLHIFMKAPVWFLIAKMSDIIGGGGWHRSFLINQAIVYAREWWLIGTKSTQHWLPYSLSIEPDFVDMTNQYIAIGVDGGIVTMVLFIMIIITCFRGLGMVQKLDLSESLGKRFCLWSIGVSLFAHVVGFFSISYFDQIVVFWYILIAIISAIVNMHNNVNQEEEQFQC
jgi:hypothetical protein